MALDNLKEGLPEYAKDLKLNLGTLSRSTELSEQQLWGTFLATAAATRNDTIISEIAEEASQHLSDEYVNAAYGAASIMAMNNVAYRAKSFLGSDYAQVRMGLRMNIIGNPGVDKTEAGYAKVQVRDFDGNPDRLTEMDALVAYLQMLGTLVDTNAAAAQEQRR